MKPCVKFGGATYTEGQIDPRGFPRYSGAEFKSGNITIFAKNIEFCPNCLRNDVAWNGENPERPECLSPDARKDDYTFLNARGARGGRGFAGGFDCPALPSPGPRPLCSVVASPVNDAFRRGASSGSRAGNVAIHFVNNPAAALKENDPTIDPRTKLFPGRIGVSGGDRGADTGLQPPCDSFKCKPVPAAPRCWFVPVIDYGGHTPAARPSKGVDGTFDVVDSGASEGLAAFADALNRMEVAHNYSFEDQYRRLEQGEFVARLTPSGVIEDYLRDTLRSAMIEQARRSADLASLGLPPPLPGLLQGLDRDGDYLGMQPDAAALARLLYRFDHVDRPGLPAGALRGYFMRTEGLLPFTRDDPKQDMQWRVIVQRLTAIDASVHNLTLATKQFHYDFYDHVRKQEQQVFVDKLDALNKALVEAEQRLKDENDTFGKIQKLAGKLGALAQSAKDAYTKFNTGDLKGGFEGVGGAAGAIRDIRDLLKKSNVDPAAIRRLIGETQTNLEAFQAETRTAQLRMIASQRKEALAVTDLQGEINKMMLFDLALFDDLYRAAVLTRIGRGAAGQGDYETNLGELMKLVDHKSVVPDFKLPVYPPLCSPGLPIAQAPQQTGSLDCLQPEVGLSAPSLFKFKASAGSDLANIPIYYTRAGTANAGSFRAFGKLTGQAMTYEMNAPTYP